MASEGEEAEMRLPDLRPEAAAIPLEDDSLPVGDDPFRDDGVVSNQFNETEDLAIYDQPALGSEDMESGLQPEDGGEERHEASADGEGSGIQEAFPSTSSRPTPQREKTKVYHDPDPDPPDEYGPQNPPKRAKHKPNAKSRRVPSERDPNARATSAKKEGLGKPPRPKRNASPSKGRSRFVSRSETPADDDGAQRLRSGRISVKPVAFWRNERIIYGETSVQGENLILPAIKEVIRTDEVVEPPKPRQRARKPASKRERPEEVEEEEDQDQDQEHWEDSPGVVQAEVMRWDPALQRGIEDDPELVGK
jgi:centromere protein C